MLDNQIFYYHSLCSGHAKQMRIVLWYNRKHKVLLRTRKFSTQGKLSEGSLLILQQHYICKLLIPLVPRGPNTTSAQPLMRLYSVQIYFWVFIAINIFYCVTFTINYPTDVVLNRMVCHSILILEAFWWPHFCVYSLTKPYQLKQIRSTL